MACAHSQAQVLKGVERFPIFPACNALQFQELETCFYNQVQEVVYHNFKVPQKQQDENYKGTVIVLFEVTNEGNFKVIYVDAIEESLVTESKRVFGLLPKI
jgi:hypothetical protein